jgi:hypothetical protein
MKVLVCYENPAEQVAANRLAALLSTAGGMLANATARPNLGGFEISVYPDTMWNVQALSVPFKALAARNPFNPKYTQPKPRRGVRQLIFEVDEDDD